MAREAVELYTDGACRGNPGPGGWGVLIRQAGSQRELSGSEPATTNNRMELTAVIRGISEVDKSCEIKIYTDSQYVQKGMTEWIHDWKRRGWRTSGRKPVKNDDLWQRLDALARGRDIEWHWVRGHAGHPENERADALANQAIDDAG